MKSLDMSVWITYFERLSKSDLYKELARVIVTSKLVESDTGLKLVTAEKSVDNNMPSIPERDKQLADLLALKVFGTDRSSVTRSKELSVDEQRYSRADSERRKLFFASLFKGLRSHWSSCHIPLENILPITKTDNLEHEQLISSPHLWTFLEYTAEHIEPTEKRGDSMFNVLKMKLSEEEIASLLSVMAEEEENIYRPLSFSLFRHWNSNGETLNSLTTTLGLEKDPISNRKIIALFMYYKHSSPSHFENVLLFRKFLATKYPPETFEKVFKDQLYSAEGTYEKALAEVFFSEWLNEGYLVKDIKSRLRTTSGDLNDKYESWIEIAKKHEYFRSKLKVSEEVP
ncbi:uncharacterized protein PHALS_10308 [Plasmopara halstedii]|uniref:Uncharacterized protein n=1 Tax=Plasmopara halstedii TaxID=4781 RepID=A0A0P1AHV4_PLAHL|nr:uncharacterized protein PHALS_10308 [Plasmopara halstedii]CEG40088.1 hypothetical protein PHALS_10308 [Plasmopara halstedii]|eukprot:XP_024576457.1 hypothetical protein PHALS_10308 [Plasmopara halstedii]